MSKNTMTIKFNKFQPSMVNFTDLEENKRSKGQKIAYVRYGDKQPFLQTPEIQLETYGIPRAGEYYKDDSQRSFIKVPLNEDFSSDVKTFKQSLVELDKIMDSDEMREKIFGSKKSAKGWEYQPLVRESMVQTIEDSDSDSDGDGEDAKSSTVQFRPSYFKAKLKTNYETGNIETVVYKKDNGDRSKEKVKTLTDLESLVTYRSTIRMVVMPNKLWAAKNMQGKKYGITLKITHLEVEPIVRSSMRDYVEGDAFLDSDDEGANATTITTQKAQSKADDSEDESDDESEMLNTKSLGNALDNDSEDDDDDSDSDSEDEPVVKKSTKSTKKSSGKGKKKTSKSANNSN